MEWIGAQADGDDQADKNCMKLPSTESATGTRYSAEPSWRKLTIHNFTAKIEPQEWEEEAFDRNPDLWMYRARTVRLLRRYMRFSLETGRLPSVVGREFFRAKMSAYPSATFEDRVIFVRDVEKCLSRLSDWDQQLIARAVLQEHSHSETAYMLHCSRKTVQRRLIEVLDLLSEDFLRSELLTNLPSQKS